MTTWEREQRPPPGPPPGSPVGPQQEISHQSVMSMSDLHQFRVRTPSFLITAETPVQVGGDQYIVSLSPSIK